MPLHYKILEAIEDKTQELLSDLLIYIHTLPTLEEKQAVVEYASFKVHEMISPETEEPPLTAQGD